MVYDQSGHGDDLAYEGPGGVGGGNEAYSLYIKQGNAYWHNGSSSGMQPGSQPQGAYVVTSGTHVNGGCCFDYGNSETDRRADGAGAMDVINFSTSCWFGGCTGSGPWVQADLEYGLYNHHRTHRSLARAALLRAPPKAHEPARVECLRIRRRDRLGGILHEYRHAA